MSEFLENLNLMAEGIDPYELRRLDVVMARENRQNPPVKVECGNLEDCPFESCIGADLKRFDIVLEPGLKKGQYCHLIDEGQKKDVDQYKIPPHYGSTMPRHLILFED